jgi:hypothetical protein
VFAISEAAQMTIGLVAVFFVFFPLVVNVLIGYIVVQVLGERRDNLEYERRRNGL